MKQSIRKSYSVTMFWNKRDMDLKTKVSSISMTVNLLRQQFRVSLKLRATKPDFDLALSSARKLTDEVRELKQVMNGYMMKAEAILNRLPNPSRESFKRLFKSETDLFISNKIEVLPFYQMKMDELLHEGRIGTYKGIKCSKAALSVFCSNPYFEDIDEKWLKSYYAYMKGRKNSETTIGIRLGCLRGIFIKARKEGFVSEQNNPFKDFKIGKSVRSKSVLYPEQVKLLFDFIPTTEIESKAKAYFFFCYLGNGMNFMDMVQLKWKDIKNDSFTFVREKTKLSSDVGEIRVHLHDEMKKIIAEYGNPLKSPDDYVFPVLRPHTDPLRQHSDRCRHKRMVNVQLAKIGKGLGFEVHLCLNLARHSFATSLMLNGTPIAFISQAMGHTNSITTEHYLKSIPAQHLKQMSNQLLSF